MANCTLVSCAVYSFNSSKTIIETLESIKAQSYQDIELIVSDDCSKDDTVSICRKWMDENEKRFRRAVMVTSPVNTGVAGNANRALAACNGSWIKVIAADDVLFSNCIEDYVNFVNDNPEIHWASSYTVKYEGKFSGENRIKDNMVISEEFFTVPVEKQLQMMVRKNVIYAPSLFLNRNMVLALGGYDEKYAVEDYPFYIRALEAGYRIYLMPKQTVGYRLHSSMSRGENGIFKYDFQVASRKYRVDLCFKYLTRKERFGMRLLWKTEDIMHVLRLNRANWFLSHFYWNVRKLIITIFLSPQAI